MKFQKTCMKRTHFLRWVDRFRRVWTSVIEWCWTSFGVTGSNLQIAVILQTENARPHKAQQTHGKLKELGWAVLPHHAYSPDLASPDFHLFEALKDALLEKDLPITRKWRERSKKGFGTNKKILCQQNFKATRKMGKVS